MSSPPSEATGLGALAGLAPELAETFVSIASDIALVIGADGIIRKVAQGDAPLTRQAGDWIGKPFVETVTSGTRGKIEQLLQEVDHQGVSRRREVNLPGAEGLDIPVAFAAIRLGQGGPVLAVGRDLRAIAAIQQRFLDVQQELEREYWRQRQAESRYRLLFQVATDAVMVVDAARLTIIEANHAAAQLLGLAGDQLVGQPASTGIEPGGRPAVDQLLIAARTSGRPAELRVRLESRPETAIDISATPFRATVDGNTTLLLMVRARRVDARSPDASRLAELVEHTPDGVVITDSSGRVQIANPAFLLLCSQTSTEQQVRGRLMGDVLGDPQRRLAQLIAEVRRLGIASQVRVSLGTPLQPLEVEVSAALLDEGDQVCIGLTLRRTETPTGLRPVGDLVQAIELLTAQLGNVSLPELMQEASFAAERHLMRTALTRVQGDLVAAADWLGITPESLILRAQRHGLASLLRPSGELPPTLLN
ncbi:MAG: transcriptional regulator PpsR [Pseudomonadota bacterium]|jgi:transcriptional regulator PpsR